MHVLQRLPYSYAPMRGSYRPPGTGDAPLQSSVDVISTALALRIWSAVIIENATSPISSTSWLSVTGGGAMVSLSYTRRPGLLVLRRAAPFMPHHL